VVDFVTFTPNPAIDMATSVERVTPFQKLRCSEAQRDPGGGGINVARVLHRFKCDVLAIFPAGGPTGDLLKRLMEEAGIPSHVVALSSDTREDFTVFEDATGNQFRFVMPGSPLDESHWRTGCEAVYSADPAPRFVIASGSLPPGAADDAYASVMRAAKSRGARAVIDTSGIALKYALDEGVYLAKPNLRELKELTGKSLESLLEQITACHDLVRSRKATVVTLTLAERGAIAVTREGAWHAKAPDIRPVSTVGAGDSFLATMIWKIAFSGDVACALQYAVAAGTAALLSPGTELCRPEDVERIVAQVVVEGIDL
jgi:6-phosphofructokinase 2